MATRRHVRCTTGTKSFDDMNVQEPPCSTPPLALEELQSPALGAAESALPRAGLEHLPEVLADTRAALDAGNIEHVVMGGIASSLLGRPRATRDIDVFMRPADADRALSHLAARGFVPERRDPSWLFKAHRHGVTVDVIFATRGGIYFDVELYSRSRQVTFAGVGVRIPSPEDLIVIKAAAHDELQPKHWWDALGVLMSSELDWEYLIHRSGRAHKRVLSLLVYAQSLDYRIPDWVVRSLLHESDGWHHGPNHDEQRLLGWSHPRRARHR